MYCASFLLQSNLAFFEAWAKDPDTSRVNIVAILVDDSIYGNIKAKLERYASEYIQKQLSDTKALVMPLSLSNISAYDIHRMMENIYFDWLKDVNSSLIWLIMVWEIPLPVVNQDWYIFPTVYPYVDFENQKYVRDQNSQYFVPNDNPGGQAEIWHWLINYWTDAQAYEDFFKKIQKYVENPDEFIWDAIWYEDFIASKEWFLNENFPYYRNRIMFGEDLSYQRYSPLMKKMFFSESTDNSVDIISNLWSVVDSIWWDSKDIFDSIDSETIESLKNQWSDGMHTAKLVQQEIQDSYLADYDDLFSSTALSTMRENVLAGWRWLRTYENASGQTTLLANVDSSSSMIQLKDTMYLWNDNLQWLLENLNELMEKMIDKKIEDEKYSMDIVIPLEYKKVTWKKIDFKCRSLTDRFENFYFGSNARYIESAKELSIYRWTYRNLRNLDGVTYDSLLTGNNPVVGQFDKTDVRLKSIWASYDIFSDQAEWNRWYNMFGVDWDMDTYDGNKTTKKRKTEHKGIFGRLKRRMWPEVCWNNDTLLKRIFKWNDDCESLHEFAKRWWWWASPINLVTEKVSEWRYELSGYLATDSWRSIYSMEWFQSLLTGEDEWMFGKWWYYGTWEWPQWAWTSYKSYIKYSSPTQREWWWKVVWWYEIYEDHNPDVHMSFNDLDYWRLWTSIVGIGSEWTFSTWSANVFNIDRQVSEKVLKCGWGEKYSYKVINSIVKHDSTSEDEINWIDKEKYGENWILSIYYNDIKDAYIDVANDMTEIVNSLPDLQKKINEIVDYINWKIIELEGQWSSLSNTKTDIANLNGEKAEKLSENETLLWEIQVLQNKLSAVVCREEISETDEEGNIYVVEKIVDNCKEKDDLRNEILNKKDLVDKNNGSIGDLEWKLNTSENNRKTTEYEIKKILDDVSNYLVWSGEEKDKISDVYNLMMWLYVENIIWTMEYIIYVEWWNPEEYELSSSDDIELVKIWFLPSWISEIQNIENSIKVDSKKIIHSYEQVYSWIISEKKAWSNLADELKLISDDNVEKIDEITELMDNILILSDEEDWEIVTATLTWGTARAEMNNLYNDFDRVWIVFWNLVEEDKVWPEVVKVAQNDIDFRKWLLKKSIEYQNFTDEDWIVQYSNWTKWDGYDSTWARENHDLLLWISIHMSWMNLLTPDRPIDSPRYVSMQSIAWNEIKLIYPDLFKVEVFVLTWQDKSGYDIHELLTWWQIKENLIKYLSGKVEEYNKILDYEYKSAKLPGSDIHYQRLLWLWFQLATPDKSVRPYGYFTYEDFENALWWSWMLDTISEMLYYQSLTNKKKLSTWMIADDIELIKKSFNLNDKRELVLEDYLVEWNEKLKNPLLLIPMYELSWYEVAYINSDWKDYIIPSEESVDTISSQSDASIIRRHQPVKQENDFDEECNIPSSWKLPLFKLEWWEPTSPWAKWFKCWLSHLKDSVKVNITFDGSLGEVIIWSWFKAYLESLWMSYISETKDEFAAWWDQMTKYADAWDTILSPWTWHDADKDITQLQLEAEKHNNEVNAWWSDASAMLKNVKISNSNAILSDSNPSSTLRIESIADIGQMTVEFMWTGDWCILVDGTRLCDGGTKWPIKFSKQKPFSGLVTTAHVAWKAGLYMKISWGWWYIEKVIKYTVSPSQLDNFEIKFYDDKTVVWMVSPMEIIWYDKYGNRVDWWLETFDVTASQGRFLKDWAYQTEISTNDFRDLRLYYQAPSNLDGDKALIQISRHNNGWQVVVNPKNPYEHKLVDWAPRVTLNLQKIILKWKTNLVANEVYYLKDDESIYDASWKLRKWKLQRLDIEIEDLKWWVVDVDEQVLVTSQNWLVYIWELQKYENWDEMFFETSKSYLSWGKATVYYYPSTVAWDDIINIDIPWLETRKINLSIKPGPLSSSQLVLEKNVLDLWDTMNIELFLSDKWGNLIDSEWKYTLFYDEDKVEFVDPNCWHDWEIEVSYVNWYGKYVIFWTWAWIAYIRFWSDYIYFNVDKHIFPDSGLNIMYLNYFWNDWWNQWWYLSDNDNRVESMMSRSNKIITTTTQLMSEDKIKKMIWKMEPWFKIWNPDGISTSMAIKWNKISMIVWEISSMKYNIQWLSWVQDIPNQGNYALFIPNNSNYSVDKNWILYNSWEYVVNIVNWDVSLQLASNFMDNWDNVWNLIYKWVNYWSVIIHYPNFSPGVWNFDTPWERYLVSWTFTHGSTYGNLSSIWIFDLLSNFELNTNYKSIQNSDELDEKIWFLWDFKNITLFGEWEIVWEATRKFWSEFVINLWDPVLSRKSLNENVYGTDYDGWIWQEIYSDPENNIFWTYEIDFNKDKIKDLLVVYLDWSIRLAKNYGGTPDLRNMQELMRIAVPIKEVFVWDADGNKWEDVIILTKNNQLRAYLNDGGMFDVNGSVACLNQNVFWWQISSTPSNLEWIFQIFVEDMNKDDVVDVITYDNKWYIKVFYWWSTKGWPNYLSNETYACDTWWYNREKSNITVVDALWISIDWTEVFDNSMLHWKWMTKPEIEISEDDLSEYGINIDEDSLPDLIKPRDRESDTSLGDAVHEIMDKDKFDVQKASKKFIDESAKYVDVTLYENTLSWEWDWNNYVFAPSSFLDPGCAADVGSVRKNYKTKSSILQDGDIVTVTVTVKASDEQSFEGAFWDVIQWPWNLYYDENKILKSIRFTLNQWDAVIKPRDWNFAYIIDNIKLLPWQKMKFEYDLEYRSVPLRTMEITYDTFYWGNDEYPDIKLHSIDWCSKDFDVYMNWWKSFTKKLVELQKMIDETYENEDEKTEDYAQDAIDAWSKINNMPGIVWNKIDRISLLDGDAIEISDDEEGKQDLKNKIKSTILQKIEEWWLEWLNMNLNVDLSIFEEQTDAIENVIDDITKWMCNGFQFGWSNNCPWLPVPFNQAFLAPWKYHLFGCRNLPLWKLEKWLPLFFFPSSLPGYPVVPIPDWMKTATDKFIWFLGDTWNYPSLVRIYVAPTLTAQLWIGICLWPYAVWEALKSPWSDLWGNCIVFAIKPQCSSDVTPTNLESPYESFSDFVEDVRDSGVCLESQKGPQNTEWWFNSAPTRWVSFWSTYKVVEPSRKDIKVDENYVDDMLSDIQKLFDSVQNIGNWSKERIDVRKEWDNAMKWRVWDVSLSMFDKLFWEEVVDKVYNKYFWNAKLTVADNYYVDYSTNTDLWIINLEREAYIASDEGSEVKNSIMIWNVDILWWEYNVNQIKWWIVHWLKGILINNWLDPQIRYIANQLNMHVNVILPDLSSLMWDDLTNIYNYSEKIVDENIMWKNYSSDFDVNVVWSDYNEFLDSEKKAISKIWDGLWWVFDEYGRNASSYKLSLSEKSISEFNDKIWNPFEALASLMNESNIINISIEPYTVKIPMIFSEDINAYQFYLNQYLEENAAIMQEWKNVLNTVKTNCSKEPTIEKQQACRAEADKNLSAFIEFEQWDWPNIVNRIYMNLMILQEYRNFPFEIYERIHVIDRYMSEIVSLVNNTVWYLSYWVVVNSERFVWYIYAITLILNIIKTYQLIIDFSVDWSKKCGNCAKDTYDQYTCKLSFLCNGIKLPIIQIPNFKLPNITLDFSNIDIWLDIILPEFNFQPVKVTLPDLPNLPEPPSIWVNIKMFDLPDIPILPEPPTLPDLPSFIPEVELELPILPPAPEIPELPNEIKGIIKFAKVVWQIYCIVKKQFGLVWENSLKAKIEQITQRTYEVNWIDNIMNFTNWSVAPLKNYGVDYEISSYVDLQFTMSDFYDYLDVLTRWINNLSEYIVNKPTDWVNDKADEIVKDLDWINWMNLNIQLWMSSPNGMDLQGIVSDDIKYVDYSSAKKRLNEVLAYFKSELNDTTFTDSIGWDIVRIENQINKPSVVSGNTEWIENMKNEIMDYLGEEKVYYKDLANLINDDYDGFLAMVDSQNDSISDEGEEKLLTFNVQLFNLDPSTKETVTSISKSNPYRSLVENKQEIIDGYRNAINSNTSESLWITEKEYLVLRNNIWSMKKQISTLYSVMTPVSSSKLVAKNWTLVSDKSLIAAWEWARIWSNMEVAKVVDPSVFSNWIYEKMTTWNEVWKLTKVVNSDSFVEEIWKNFYDTNHYWPHDIILRDENSIYKKCVSQACNGYGYHFPWYYMEEVSKVPYEETRIDFWDNTILKIADWDVEVKNWKVIWQSYDLLSFSWDLSDADAYLIKLVDRIDYSYEKVDYAGSKRVSYVLALPNWVDLSDLLENKVKLELIKDRKKKDIKTIESLFGKDKDLVQVVYYDSTKDKADVIISDVDRKWYYWRISTLDLQWDTYYINSPWSNQVVAWKQILWDAKGWWSDEPPTVQEELFRPSVNKVVSEWDELEGYVWTKYVLNMYWKDNVALAYIDVSQDWNVLTGKYTSEKEDLLSIPIDMHFYNEQETFDLYWVDQFWNETRKTVTITFSIPTIRITDVSKNLDWETVDITAELSQDIDEWNVSFQRKRGNTWKTMKRENAEYSDLFVWKDDKVVIWTGYSFWNQIAMYNKDDSIIALLNPDTSEIKLQSGYEDKFDIIVRVENSAVLYVHDKQTNENKFSVSIPTDKCINIVVDEPYKLGQLPEDWAMWMFNWWQVVHRDWNNILIVSPTCHLYSEYGLEGIYNYDSERDAVLLELFESSDVNKTSPIKVWLKTKSFLPK